MEQNITQNTETKLMDLQKRYLRNRSDSNASKLYHTLYPYIKSIILKNLRHKIKADRIDYYIENTITLLFYEYLKNPDFQVNDSFGGYLFNKIRQSIYGKDEKDVGVYQKVKKLDDFDVRGVKPEIKDLNWKKENFKKVEVVPSISLNYTLPDGSEVEYIDKKNIILEVELYRDKQLLRNNVIELLFAIDEMCNSNSEMWHRYGAIYLHCYKGEKKADKFFEVFGRVGKEKYDQSFELLFNLLSDDYKIEREEYND